MTSDPRVHAFEEVAKHNKTKDCWLIISGKVYDVSLFMEDHPGGSEVLLAATGRDATNDFEDIGHSDEAREQMGSYCIGEVDPATVPLKRAYFPTETHKSNNNTVTIIKKTAQFLLPLFILGLAFALRQYFS